MHNMKLLISGVLLVTFIYMQCATSLDDKKPDSLLLSKRLDDFSGPHQLLRRHHNKQRKFGYDRKLFREGFAFAKNQEKHLREFIKYIKNQAHDRKNLLNLLLGLQNLGVLGKSGLHLAPALV